MALRKRQNQRRQRPTSRPRSRHGSGGRHSPGRRVCAVLATWQLLCWTELLVRVLRLRASHRQELRDLSQARPCSLHGHCGTKLL
jgi:hypothetical protein